jgi:hypothetical protein
MTDRTLIVRVTLLDDATNKVVEEFMQIYDAHNPLGYEIARMFEKMGERFAKELDPYHDR